MGRFFSKMMGGPDGLSLEPLLKDIQRYTVAKAKSDLWAALAVALLSIPQALAYSVVVGVSPLAGVISMVLGTSIAALLGSSSHLVVGPNNATCLLLQAAAMETIGRFSLGVPRETFSLELVVIMTLLIGCTQLVASFFALGRLIQFVSHSVVVAYITGTAVAIAVGQLYPLVGMSCPDGLDSISQKFIYFVMHVGEAHGATAIVGGLSIALVIVMWCRQWKFSGHLIMLASMAAYVALLRCMPVTQPIGQSIALIASDGMATVALTPHVPYFDLRLLNALLPIAFAIALIGALEANSIAKAIASKTGQRLSGNQGVFALGCANFILSFFGALPCSGSASRSCLNVETGAQTRFAAFFSGGIVAICASAFGPAFAYVPHASLAALLILTAWRLIDIPHIQFCWRATKSDALVLTITFCSCIFFSLPLALYMGVALSIILYLRKASMPRVGEYVYEEMTGEIHPAHDEEKKLPRAIRLINVEGELFFGAMDLFQYTLRAIAEDDVTTKVIMLRLKHVHDLDATTALALRQLKDYLNASGRSLIVYGVPSHVLELLENVHLIEHLGRENVITCDAKAPHTALERSLTRARTMLREQQEPSLPHASHTEPAF